MAITVTTHSDPPSADLFISGLPSGTTRVRVWRMWADQEQRVRGDEQAGVISLETRLEDYDVPVGRPVSYRAQCFAVDGTELAPLSATSPVTITLADINTAWVSDPLAPALARMLTLDVDSDGSRSYESETTYAQIIGKRRPVAISGIRAAAGDWKFTFKAYSFEESTAVDALASAGGTILIRTAASAIRHDTGLIYLSAPAVQEIPRHDMVLNQERADWVFAGRECEPPTVAVVMPLREYADMEAENDDYQGVIDDFTDYLALLRG